MRGILARFSKIFDFHLQTPKNAFLHIFAQLQFSKNFCLRVPPQYPYTPMTPQNPKFRKFLLRPNHVQNRFPAFFCDIRKFFAKFCLVPKGTFSRFLAIFLDFCQKGQKSKNIEFRAPTSTAIALKVVLCTLYDKSESEKKYAGVAKTYLAVYSRIDYLGNLAQDRHLVPPGVPPATIAFY